MTLGTGEPAASVPQAGPGSDGELNLALQRGNIERLSWPDSQSYRMCFLEDLKTERVEKGNNDGNTGKEEGEEEEEELEEEGLEEEEVRGG